MGKSNKLSDSRRKQLEQAKQNAKNKANNKPKASNYATGSTSTKSSSYAANRQGGTQRTGSNRTTTNRTGNTNRVTGGKNTVTNRNVRQADKVTGARPYQQSVKGLGNTVGITRDDSEQKKAAQQKAIQTANENRRRQTQENLQARRRQPAIDTLNANSVRWHNTTDEAEKNRLHAANNRIRSLYGMTYDDKTGRTYLPKAGQNVNVSHPVELYSGAQQPQTVFDTQEEKDKRYNEIQAEINRMKNAYGGFQTGLSDNKKADKDAKKQLIKTLEKERNAVTGGTTRKVQAAKAIGNQIVGAPAALAETAQQQSANVEESRKNPEYVKLEQQEEQLELTLAGIPSTDADGKPSAEYMQVYNQLQDVKKQKDSLAVKTAVDPNKWGQQRLAKAEEQKANATTGMTAGQKFAADTAISMAGNAPQMATAFIPVVGPAAATAWSGINAAGQRAYELNQQGVAPNEALGRSIVSGVIEAATEKSPMESLANIATRGGKSLVGNIAKQALSEAGEEGLSYAANYAADVAANDPNAHFSLSELGQNALGGAAGGAMFAGIGTGIHALRNGVNYLPTARNRNNAAQNQTAPVDTQTPTQYTNNNGGVINGTNGQQNGNGSIGTGIYANGRVANQPLSAERQNGRGNPGVYEGVLVNRETRQIMNERGMVDFGLRESTGDNASFSRALDAAKASNPHGAFVDSQPAENLNAEGTRTFMSPDGMAGAAVKRDGDIVGVFKNSADTRPGAVNDLIITALSNGGNKLDCYGMDLGDKYTQLGFVPVARMEFNPEYATDWKPEFGTPDVIFWMHNGDSAETVARKRGSYQYFDDNYIMSLPTFTDYDAAGQYRDMLLAQQKAGRTQNVNTQNPYDINPKLRTAAQAAQESAQNAPAEITQPMQGNAQGAALGARQAAQQTAQANNINPTLKKAGVSAESSVGAAQSGFDPYSKMVNDYGAIPEGMNPARTIDVPQSTNGTDRVSNVARTIMESGVTPDSLIPALENHVAEGLFSHDVKSLKKTLSGATKTIQKKGWQGAFDQWEEVTDGRRAVTDDDIALGQMMYTAAVEAGDTQTAMKLAADLAVQGTALGRGVNAFKLLKKTTPEGQLYYLQKAVQRIQEEYQSRFDKQAGKEAKKRGVPAEDIADQYGLKLNEDLVQEFLNAETEEARTKVVDKIYDDVAQQIPKTAGDRLNAWRYFAMLGNPRTHVRNVMGNVASAIALDASHKVSAAGQKFLPQDQRTRALHTSKAAHEFAKADYANVKAELTGNAYKTEMSEIRQRQKLFPKLMQTPMDKASELLDREDLAFKKSSYIKSMGNFLTARGWDVNNLTEAQLNEARQHAIEDAKIATFQDASALADTLGRLEKKNKAWGVAIGSLVPFKRTPINVAKRSFELSPVGLLKAITYDAVQVKKGNMDATKMVDHISEGLTGSGIAALGAFLAAQGVFSAGSSDDDKEANLDAGMGQQEYAINIGGKSYTIDWAAPAVVPLAMGGELYNALHQKYDDEETAFNQAMATVSRMFDPMLNMTMLSGIGSTVSSAAYNKSNPLFGIASNVATNFGGQFVPTLFGQIARTVDNTRRTTYADKNSPVPSSVQKFLQRQANKIPGLSQYQPAYTDVWGREQKNGPDNVFARAAYNFFSPGYLADAKGTQTEKALKELYQATGDNSVLPSKPQKYYKTDDGTKKFLTAQEYSALTSEGGKIALDALGKLTKSEAYKGMTNDEKIEAVSDVYKYAKAVAANKTYGKELEGTIKTVKDSGIEPGLYYAYKEMEDSYNDSMESWEARDQTFNSIKGDKSLSEQEKNSLYHTLLIKGTSDSQWEKYQEISGKVTAEEYVDAMIQKQAITKEGETIEKGRAAQEATEFSYYLDSKGYTGEKRQALEDTFKFYSMVKADPANYTYDMIRENGGAKEKEAIGEVESAGLTAPQYAQIKNATSGVTYEKGKTGAKKAAVAAVVSKNVENASQFSAVMHALGYKKIDGLYTSGGTLPEDKAASTGISVNRATGFSNPTKVSDAVITSGYGGRSAPTTNKGKGSTQHDGIDIGGSVNGQAADSIGGGKVTEVGYDENGYGNYVVVDHGNGYTSLYGHLQKATVKQGDTISAGQQVGVIGSTGKSSGPHLHLRVHKNGQSIDPRTVIPGYGG